MSLAVSWAVIWLQQWPAGILIFPLSEQRADLAQRTIIVVMPDETVHPDSLRLHVCRVAMTTKQISF